LACNLFFIGVRADSHHVAFFLPQTRFLIFPKKHVIKKIIDKKAF